MGPQPWGLQKLYDCENARGANTLGNGAAALEAAETLRDAMAHLMYSSWAMGPQPWELRKPPSHFTFQK